MSFYQYLKWAFLLLFAWSCGNSFAQIPAPATYLHCGYLLHPAQGRMEQNVTVVVVQNTIQAVLAGYQTPPKGSTLIDLKDQYVLPGLMDMHVHIEHQQNPDTYLETYTFNDADIAFRAAKYARITLLAGFTTVRDLGGTGVNVALRKAIQGGWAIGPRIYTAGNTVSITGGHGDNTNGARDDLFDVPTPADGIADGVDACRKAVREQMKKGADLIKVTATGGVLSVARDGKRPQFVQEELAVIVQTANDFGVKVAAHAHGDEGMRRAVEAGVASIEHGTFMSEATMRLMKERGTFYVPTITAGKAVADSAKVAGFFPPIIRPKAEEVGPQIQATFAKAHKAGVKIAFGTDAGVFPHGLNALEFQYMTEAGMSNLDAIRAATVGAAELLGVQDKIGSVEAGKWADIIAVRQNPLENVKTFMQVSFVMKDGTVYKDVR